MKTSFYYFFIPLAFTMFLTGCGDDDDDMMGSNPPLTEVSSNELPDPGQVVLDVPDVLSSDVQVNINGRVNQEDINSDGIYELMRLFVYVGETSAEIVREILLGVIASDIDNLIEFSLISDDDDRRKDFFINQNVTFEGVDYQFELEAFDEDGAQAFQMVWNRSPLLGVAILKPFDIDRNEDESNRDVFLRIDFGVDREGYENFMEVSITNIPPGEEDEEVFLDNLRMFVGKNGDNFEVFGNANLPNFILVDQSITDGRNYAFVARAEDELDIAVAEVAIPPSTVSTSDGLITEFSVVNVLTDELMAAGITDQAFIDAFVAGAEGPGYFEEGEGLIATGSDIPENPGFSEEFIDLSGLQPFVPSEIRDLTLDFLNN